MGVRDYRHVGDSFDNSLEIANRLPNRQSVLSQVWLAGKQGVSAKDIAQAISSTATSVLEVCQVLIEEGAIIKLNHEPNAPEVQHRYVRVHHKTRPASIPPQ